jgi:hypothetical protein
MMKMKTLAMAAALAALTASAEKTVEVKIDNRFIADSASDCGIRGWKYNPVKAYQPYGTVEAVMRGGVAGVSLKSTGRVTTIVLTEHLKVKSGERYRMTADVKGKGKFSFSVFQADFPWKWRGTQGDNRMAAAEGGEVVQEITVPADVKRMYPAISVNPGAEVEVMDFKLVKVFD